MGEDARKEALRAQAAQETRQRAEKKKEAGNACLKAKDYEGAIAAYTEGLAIDATWNVLYSNRSQAQFSLERYKDALDDANACIKADPNFWKGYSRKAAALTMLKRHFDAASAWMDGLEANEKEPNLRQGLTKIAEDAERRKDWKTAKYSYGVLYKDDDTQLSIKLKKEETEKKAKAAKDAIRNFMANGVGFGVSKKTREASPDTDDWRANMADKPIDEEFMRQQQEADRAFERETEEKNRQITDLCQQRSEARAARQYGKADALLEQLKEMGVEQDMIDDKAGTWRDKHGRNGTFEAASGGGKGGKGKGGKGGYRPY